MTTALLEPVVVGSLVFASLVMASAAVAGLVLWRTVRRRWRAFHAHGAVVGAVALWELAGRGRIRPRSPMSPGDTSRWTARTVRREMWRAVDQAEDAVRAADSVDAPTAELSSLCARVRSTAVSLDRVLRVDPAGPVPPGVAAQVTEVVRTATDLQAAAVSSASDATAHQVDDLSSDAAHEIGLLDAGLASARAVLPRRSR